MRYLFVKTPVAIADSGHKSLTSNIKGIDFNLESNKAEIPVKRDGDVTMITSGFSKVTALKNAEIIVFLTNDSSILYNNRKGIAQYGQKSIYRRK